MTAETMKNAIIEEEAFGKGRARVWDAGAAEIRSQTEAKIDFDLLGAKLTGRFELRRMRWYPGNRWLLEKTQEPEGILT
jgi:hypothetical protein